MGKIKISTIGKLSHLLFSGSESLKGTYKIISLRSQIEDMTNMWRNVDIVTQLTNYREVNKGMHEATMFSLDEERMKMDLGEEAVIKRLTNDRDKIVNLLKNVKELDLSDIKKLIREEKINEVIK